ncbi:MAG: phenylalanine--tRNA ligase beta subunit-related protein [Patescibacteria group bacterium]|nr:phenylalanine--tRNA ligase beta subunit-related protein [bacterium]MDZ4240816.1 phenylalanine--tRNA ligase beta subunit-related protein [Patescibacteria group bacterium]
MKISYHWLADYILGSLPKPDVFTEAIEMSAFEVESVEEKGEDVIFDLAVLPNRNHDCLSHRGIAREAALLLNLPLKKEEKTEKYPISKTLSISLAHPFCRRYVGALVRDIKVGQSPEWLKKRLEAIGQRSINNIVDATNYVMFSLGQPLHAFDADKFEKKADKISISLDISKKGEKMEALDEKTYDLPQGTPLIRDGNSGAILGIAGIKGGRAAEISSQTKNIVLEAANFDPILVRKFSKDLNLRTDASLRFENEISATLAMEAMQSVVTLILDIAHGDKTSVEGVVDIYPNHEVQYKVGISKNEIEQILGIALQKKDIENILTRAGFSYEIVSPRKKIVEDAKKYIGTPYKRGASVGREGGQAFDCSSFVAYLYVSAGVGIPRISVDQYVWGSPVSEKETKPGDVIYANTGVGEHGVHYETKEFLKGTKVPEGVDHCGVYIGDGEVAHATQKAGKVVIEKIKESDRFKHIAGYRRHIPSEEERFVVTVPFTRLDVRIKEDLAEEIGRVYGYSKIASVMPPKASKPPVHKRFYYTSVIRHFLIEKGFSETYTYSLISHGDIEIANPLAEDKNFLRPNLQGGVKKALEENLRNADLLGLDAVKIFEIGTVFSMKGEILSFTLALKGQKSKEKKEIEELAETVENLGKHLGVQLPPVSETCYEIDLGDIIDSLPEPKAYEKESINEHPKQVEKISAYPFMLRDISLFVPSGITSYTVLSVIAKEAGDLLVQSRLFDVFEKTNAEGGKQTSYAFRLVFQSFEKTLSDEEINVVMKRVSDALEKEKNWKVR